jgi:hypothetical protein
LPNGFNPKNVGIFKFLAITLAITLATTFSLIYYLSNFLIEGILCYQIVIRIIYDYLLTLDLWLFIPDTVRLSKPRIENSVYSVLVLRLGHSQMAPWHCSTRAQILLQFKKNISLQKDITLNGFREKLARNGIAMATRL